MPKADLLSFKQVLKTHKQALLKRPASPQGASNLVLFASVPNQFDDAQVLYTPLMDREIYKDKVPFLYKMIGYLNTLYQSNQAKHIIQALVKGSNEYSITDNRHLSADASYRPHLRTLDLGNIENENFSYALITLAHELYHAFAHEEKQWIGNSVNAEVQAFVIASRVILELQRKGKVGTFNFRNYFLARRNPEITAVQVYQRAMAQMAEGRDFNLEAYKLAIANFHAGLPSDSHYLNLKIDDIPNLPLLSRFYAPLSGYYGTAP